MNLPPYFNTLNASDSANLVLGTFLNPKDIVYASKVLSQNGNSSALAHTNQISQLKMNYVYQSASQLLLSSSLLKALIYQCLALLVLFLCSCAFPKFEKRYPQSHLPHPTLLNLFYSRNHECKVVMGLGCLIHLRIDISNSDGCPSTSHHSSNHICLPPNGRPHSQEIALIMWAPIEIQSDCLPRLKRIFSKLAQIGELFLESFQSLIRFIDVYI